jgi:hypothetical protein
MSMQGLGEVVRKQHRLEADCEDHGLRDILDQLDVCSSDGYSWYSASTNRGRGIDSVQNMLDVMILARRRIERKQDGSRACWFGQLG